MKLLHKIWKIGERHYISHIHWVQVMWEKLPPGGTGADI